MNKKAKEYQKKVVDVLIRKHNMSELEAYKAIRATFLYDSLCLYPEETLHDDIETNADFVYEDYMHPQLMRM